MAKTIAKCVEAINIINYFHMVLLSLKYFWQDCKCDIAKVSEFNLAQTQRGYLSEFCSVLQLLSQGYCNVESKHFIFNGFEKQINLESFMHAYFFDKGLIDFLNMSKSNDKENLRNLDKFKILRWEV